MVPKIWFDIRNLSKISFLNPDFCQLVVFMVKIKPKDGQFSYTSLVVFRHFPGDHSKYVDQTRSEVRPNEHKADAKDRSILDPRREGPMNSVLSVS